MGRPANITLAATRARARQIHPRVVIVNAMLFNAAGVLIAALWSATICLTNGWGVVPGIFMAAAAAVATSGLWLLSCLAWLLQADLSGVKRMSRGWMTAIVLVAVVGALVASPWWAAFAAMGGALAATPLLARFATRVDGTKMTSWNLPPTLLPALRSLPDRLPPHVDSILDMAFRDWVHLRDLVGFTAQSALKAYVDMDALSRDAERTVLYLMRRAPVVAKLVDLANERGEPAANRAATKAVQRLHSVGEVLHEAVVAASQFAASEEREEAHELKIRVDGLKELASSLEIDGFEIDTAKEQLNDPTRFRVSELMPEPPHVAQSPPPPAASRVVQPPTASQAQADEEAESVEIPAEGAERDDKAGV